MMVSMLKTARWQIYLPDIFKSQLWQTAGFLRPISVTKELFSTSKAMQVGKCQGNRFVLREKTKWQNAGNSISVWKAMCHLCRQEHGTAKNNRLWFNASRLRNNPRAKINVQIPKFYSAASKWKFARQMLW